MALDNYTMSALKQDIWCHGQGLNVDVGVVLWVLTGV